MPPPALTSGEISGGDKTVKNLHITYFCSTCGLIRENKLVLKKSLKILHLKSG